MAGSKYLLYLKSEIAGLRFSALKYYVRIQSHGSKLVTTDKVCVPLYILHTRP